MSDAPGLIDFDSDRPEHTATAEQSSPAESLASLVGIHPAALRDLYGAGRAVDPDELGGELEGRLLDLPLESTFLVARPIVIGISRHLGLWRGASFEADQRRGRHLVGPWQMAAFRCACGPSELDGKPTLFLTHDEPGSHWPVKRLVCELREVAKGVAIGPASLRTVRGPVLLAWLGLRMQPTAPTQH